MIVSDCVTIFHDFRIILAKKVDEFMYAVTLFCYNRGDISLCYIPKAFAPATIEFRGKS